MTNVQEALKSAIKAFEQLEAWEYERGFELNLEEKDALNQCKAALAEIEASSTGISNNAIEKCEPVLKVHHGEICYKSQADDQSYGMWCPVNFDTEHTFKEGTEFFTSPQPREWVGLSNDDINKLKNLEGTNRERTATEMAFAVQAKLKQLNTKG